MTKAREFALAESEVVEAWQCIGCGRVELPQPCIGVCQDRKVRFRRRHISRSRPRAIA